MEVLCTSGSKVILSRFEAEKVGIDADLSGITVGTLSTEGQAFTLMMMAAWRDWLGLGV